MDSRSDNASSSIDVVVFVADVRHVISRDVEWTVVVKTSWLFMFDSTHHPASLQQSFASAGAMEDHSLMMTTCIILTENCLSLVTEMILSADMIRWKLAVQEVLKE
jgi:hypothetical protein